MRSRWLRSCSPTRTEPPRVRSKPSSVVLRRTLFARPGAGGSRRPPVLTPAPSYRGGTPCFPPRDPYPRLARAHHARAWRARERNNRYNENGYNRYNGYKPWNESHLETALWDKERSGLAGGGGTFDIAFMESPIPREASPGTLGEAPTGSRHHRTPSPRGSCLPEAQRLVPRSIPAPWRACKL